MTNELILDGPGESKRKSNLQLGVVPDGTFLKRVGNTIIGAGTSAPLVDGLVSGLVLGDGAARQINTLSLVVLKDGAISSIPDAFYTVTNNLSGFPRTDMLQWNGLVLTVKPGIPGTDGPCPAPDAGNIPICLVFVPDSPGFVVDDMNKQANIGDPVIVAYYYANGGLHASRVGAQNDPALTSNVYVDAQEMMLSYYITRPGFRYELAWDVQVRQNYFGILNEGFTMNMSFDGLDEDEDVQPRGYIHTNFSGFSLHGFILSQIMCYNRLQNLGSHILKGRIKLGNISAPEIINKRRRRIWLVEVQ